MIRKYFSTPFHSNNVTGQIIQNIEKSKRTDSSLLRITPSFELNDDSCFSAEELCKELKDAFEVNPDERFADIADELIEAVSQFAHVYYRSNLMAKHTLITSQKDVIEVLKDLNDNENMFTFPEDLLKHCNSLKDVGVIDKAGIF